MNLEKKLKTLTSNEIWQEYCGFLDLTMDEYMNIQYRLLDEQIDLLSKCGLGQRFLKGQLPKNADEFRQMERLETLTGVAIPANLKGLEEKTEHHTGVIEKEKMLSFVMEL